MATGSSCGARVVMVLSRSSAGNSESHTMGGSRRPQRRAALTRRAARTEARSASFTADPHDRRTVVVQLWYPAQKSPAGTRRAQYLGRTEHEARTVSDALAREVGLPGFLVDGVPRAHTRSVFNAPVAGGGGRFPVVLFSPGSGGVRTQNTAWAEELASHGYLVAALDHPYDSAAVVLTDGRTIHHVRSILSNPRHTGYEVWNEQPKEERLLDIDDVTLGSPHAHDAQHHGSVGSGPTNPRTTRSSPGNSWYWTAPRSETRAISCAHSAHARPSTTGICRTEP